MVDTITLGITVKAWDRDTRLWSRDDFMRRKSGRQKIGCCQVMWRKNRGGVHYSISASVGSMLKGHNRDVLTHNEVEQGLNLIVAKFNESFSLQFGIDNLKISRIDFFDHVEVPNPAYTLTAVGNCFDSTKRDWVKVIASETKTVIRKVGSRVECYYTKYDPSIEGDLPAKHKADNDYFVLPRGIVRAEVRLTRLAFRSKGLNQLDVAADVLQFIERGYAELMMPVVELVESYAEPVDELELLERLTAVNGAKSGYNLWHIHRDMQEHGAGFVGDVCGAKHRTLKGWLDKINTARRDLICSDSTDHATDRRQ
jgi:hypothetical protein